MLLEKVDYWDFGTLKRYWETSFKILETYAVNSTHPFLRFLVAERALKTWKIDLHKNSYGSKSVRVINLTEAAIDPTITNTIVLAPSKVEPRRGPTVWWHELSEEVT